MKQRASYGHERAAHGAALADEYRLEQNRRYWPITEHVRPGCGPDEDEDNSNRNQKIKLSRAFSLKKLLEETLMAK